MCCRLPDRPVRTRDVTLRHSPGGRGAGAARGRSGGTTTALRIALALALGVVSVAAAQDRGPVLSPPYDTYLASDVRLTSSERRRLDEGVPVTKLLPGDASRDVAVFGAVWINAPIQRYLQRVRDIETFEDGRGFNVTRKISTPPRLEDFSDLRLPDDDVDDLRTCRIGRCEVKLDEPAMRRLQSEVDWRSPNARATVDRLMREQSFAYVKSYLEGGNARLAVYQDTDTPTDLAGEFREMLEEMPEFTTYLPGVRRQLLEYPQAVLPDSTSFLYWQETEFGLKPTIRISHVTIREGASDAMMVSKMIYASHYFRAAVELRLLVPDRTRGQGFWLLTVNRSRLDGLSGFTGLLVRRRVRSGAQNGVMATLRATKRKLEAPVSGG